MGRLVDYVGRVKLLLAPVEKIVWLLTSVEVKQKLEQAGLS